MGKQKKKDKTPSDITPIAENRRARRDYEILETLECGLELRGTEVKSLRLRQVDFKDAYAIVKNDEVWLLGLAIHPYAMGTHENHEMDRTRKLLLHRKEIEKLDKAIRHKGHTLVPLKIYFKKGWAKVLIGVAKGRSRLDKRDVIKKRESDIEMGRALRRGNR